MDHDRLAEAQGCIYWLAWAVMFLVVAVMVLGCVFWVVLTI